MTFSGALVNLLGILHPLSPIDFPLQTLTDLNDYITPSQACIKPVQQTNAPKVRAPGDAAVRTDNDPYYPLASSYLVITQTEIQIDASGAYYEVGQAGADSSRGSGSTQRLQTAEISLNDCLACRCCLSSHQSIPLYGLA
jgi:hypothetical protein